MEPRRPRPSSRPVLLIVDCHDETLAVYALALSAMGFHVVPASNCQEAYDWASATYPDIIVTELTLSSGDGWDLLRRLKGDARTRDIPVAVLTDDGAPSSRQRAERQGCAAFLLKPCLPGALAIELHHILAELARHESASPPPVDGDTRPRNMLRN